ncbi:MAG: hypothetical protein ABL956_00795 [Hyphomonadaceae bacterium]
MKMRVGFLAAITAMIDAPAYAGPTAENVMQVFTEHCIDMQPDHVALRDAARAKGYLGLSASALGPLGSAVGTLGLVLATGYRIETPKGDIVLAVQEFGASNPVRKVACVLEWFGDANDTPRPRIMTLFGNATSREREVTTWENIDGPWERLVFSFNNMGGRYSLRLEAK